MALLAALMMTSCSDSDGGESVRSGQELADLIGCTGWSNTSEEADADSDNETLTYDAYVKEGGLCQLDGNDVGVYYFLDDTARNGYLTEGSELGKTYLFGDNWVIEASSAVLDQLEVEHGGTRSAVDPGR